jgi:hypothetical protein
MSTQSCHRLIPLLALLAGFGVGLAHADDQEENEPEKRHPFAVKFVDEAGKPVVGALAGVTAYFGHKRSPLPAVDESGWQYFTDAIADADGVSHFPDGAQLDHLCIVGRHAGRKLIAIEKIDPARFDPEKVTATPTVTMRPECRVSGRLTSHDLTRRNREVGWTNVYLNLAGNRALGCSSEKQTFHFFVPPGEFTLHAYGHFVHGVARKITVKPGQRELTVGPIDLPATRLA